MNIHNINFASELPKYKIVDEKNTFFALIDLMNKEYRDEDVDKSISVNNRIYLDTKAFLTDKLNAEKILGNAGISDDKFNQIIKDESYRLSCFQAILNYIHTYKAHPSEEDLTLFLLGTTGGLLAEFLYQKEVVEYSREKYGYALIFKNSQIASDYFIMELVEMISQLGFPCQALALEYM